MADFQHLLRPRSAHVLQQAGFFRRLFAFVIDLLILDLFVAAPFGALFEGIFQRASSSGWSQIMYTQKEYAAILLLFLIAFFYFVLFEYLLGQTVGMSLLNIRLDGEVGVIAIMVRNCFLLPVFPFVLFWVVEPIAILFWRRRVLEIISKTRTLHQRNIVY